MHKTSGFIYLYEVIVTVLCTKKREKIHMTTFHEFNIMAMRLRYTYMHTHYVQSYKFIRERVNYFNFHVNKLGYSIAVCVYMYERTQKSVV